MSVPVPPITPAMKLEGMVLLGEWTVGPMLAKPSFATGGNHSRGYVATKANGEQAFVKAIDFLPIIQRNSGHDPVKVMLSLTEAFDLERALISTCRKKDRVVAGIGDGSIVVDGIQVPFLVFEKADADVRQFLAKAGAVELAWLLRTIHHVTVGIWQLHGSQIAHQDLKPSNVMVFDAETSKVGDLGRASIPSKAAQHDGFDIPGDHSYAPVELLYKHVEPDWAVRRAGGDLYLLGSLIVQLFMGTGVSGLIRTKLAPEHRWGTWTGNYADVRQHVLAAFVLVIEDFKSALPNELKEPLGQAVFQLSHPFPEERGHPSSRQIGLPLSLERFVSQFDRIATRAELGLR